MVLLVGHQDVVGIVHGVVQQQGSAVGSVCTLRELPLGASEAAVLGIGVGLDADVAQEVTQADTGPVGCADCTRTPVETCRGCTAVMKDLSGREDKS